jgi:hypothetical protein
MDRVAKLRAKIAEAEERYPIESREHDMLNALSTAADLLEAGRLEEIWEVILKAYYENRLSPKKMTLAEIKARIEELLAAGAISVKTGPDGKPVLRDGEIVYVPNERTGNYLAGLDKLN